MKQKKTNNEDLRLSVNPSKFKGSVEEYLNKRRGLPSLDEGDASGCADLLTCEKKHTEAVDKLMATLYKQIEQGKRKKAQSTVEKITDLLKKIALVRQEIVMKIKYGK